MITSKITSKAQTTIPQTVRDILRVGPGDQLVYRIHGSKVILERAEPGEEEFEALNLLLGEWSSPENDIYNGL